LTGSLRTISRHTDAQSDENIISANSLRSVGGHNKASQQCTEHAKLFGFSNVMPQNSISSVQIYGFLINRIRIQLIIKSGTY